MTEIMNGKKLADRIIETIRLECEATQLKPGLAVILVGDNPASAVYVRMKEKACTRAGFYSEKINLDSNIEEKELLDVINRLNKDSKIDGILLQLPIPEHLDEKKLLSTISPEKDVDGFHPVSAGKLLIGDKGFIPCTPRGIIELLKEYDIEIKGKKAVVIGRSNIVGKPMSLLLLRENATVTICHSKTANLAEECSSADILIAAIGKPAFIKEDFVKDSAVVVDVGMNSVENLEIAESLFGKDSEKYKKVAEKGYILCGDVDFQGVFNKVSHITPVPGGVGPLTIAMLLKNTFESAKIKQK